MSEINFLNVFFDVESEYEVDFPATPTVFALEGETIIISDLYSYSKNNVSMRNPGKMR
jgi:hypothetical protein